MSPTPLSLLCALLLTLPLAFLFTITTDTTVTVNPTTRPPRLLKTYSHNKPFNKNTSPPPPPELAKKLIDDDHNNNNSINNDNNDNDEDDNKLFQLASRVNTHPSPKSQKKLAFMFLTTGPLPLAPLWERFFKHTKTINRYNIYIHSDPNLRHDLIYTGVFANRTIPAKPTRRHTPSLAAAHRRLLARALLHDRDNYMFCLLSPTCIPLHSFDFTYETLINSDKSFIEILEREGGAWGRWAARGESVMLPEVEFSDFRIGSQFSVLTRQHARVAVNDTRIWSKFKLPCLTENVYRCYPEENYFPTLLSMVDRVGCVPATLTYVDWKQRHDGHPRSFRGAEVGPELIMAIRGKRPRYGDEEVNGSDVAVTGRNDPFLFARKFGADTVGALMAIADEVILRD